MPSQLTVPDNLSLLLSSSLSICIFSALVCTYLFLLVDVSCLKLPPSGGVMNR